MEYKIPKLSFNFDLESKVILKKRAEAPSALAEMKGVAAAIPNGSILIATLSLQDAKDSSAIEKITTTQDDLYQSDSFSSNFTHIAAKEVHSYANALPTGFEIETERGFIPLRVL